MFGVVVLEDCVTLMAHLLEKTNTKTPEHVIDQELEGKGYNVSVSKFYLVACKDKLV